MKPIPIRRRQQLDDEALELAREHDGIDIDLPAENKCCEGGCPNPRQPSNPRCYFHWVMNEARKKVQFYED